MGTKFAHLSIRDADLDEAKTLLRYLSMRPHFSPGGVVAAFMAFFPDRQAEMEELQKDTGKLETLTRLLNMPTVVYVGRNGRWITVASEEFGFESIQEQALALSRHSQRTFMAFAVFDDDVLVLSLVQNGAVLTRHVSGGEGYGMASCNGEAHTIATILDITAPEAELQDLLRNDDPYEKTTGLERLTKMALWLPMPPDSVGWASGIRWEEVRLKGNTPETAH